MDEFDIEYEDAVATAERLRIGNAEKSDKLICSCGHAISRHRYDSGLNRWLCRPNAYKCPCLIRTPVMEVSNTRHFMMKNQGSGAKHALSMGYAASKEKLGEDFKADWVIEPKCTFCHKETKYYPVRVTDKGVILLDSEDDKGVGVTVFLCESCRAEQFR